MKKILAALVLAAFAVSTYAAEATDSTKTTKKAKKLVCVLVNSEMKAYMITAMVKEDLTSGPLFEGTNAALKPLGMQAKSVWTFEPQGVWDQSANYNAGKKIA